MFGKIGDKIKRKAYLSAVSESHNEQVVQQQNAQFRQMVAKERANEARPVVSGKDAQVMAKKELNISSDSKKRGIIGKNLADMKFYKDWRTRINDSILNENFDEPEIENKATRHNDFDDGELENVPGGVESQTRKYLGARAGYKTILDRDMGRETRESGEQRESLFDRLLRKTQELRRVEEEKNKKAEVKISEPEEDFSMSDFEDDIAGQSDYSVVAKTAKKVSDNSGMQKKTRGSYKKKKKIDSDIIGSAGFFTIG
ncbi:MAG: hypothetical protein K6F08_01705 [bacterium]|nr:hypothetical protein [bacterium]